MAKFIKGEIVIFEEEDWDGEPCGVHYAVVEDVDYAAYHAKLALLEDTDYGVRQTILSGKVVDAKIDDEYEMLIVRVGDDEPYSFYEIDEHSQSKQYEQAYEHLDSFIVSWNDAD